MWFLDGCADNLSVLGLWYPVVLPGIAGAREQTESADAHPSVLARILWDAVERDQALSLQLIRPLTVDVRYRETSERELKTSVGEGWVSNVFTHVQPPSLKGIWWWLYVKKITNKTYVMILQCCLSLYQPCVVICFLVFERCYSFEVNINEHIHLLRVPSTQYPITCHPCVQCL